MDDLELVKMRLSRMPVEALGVVAKASGVPYGTLWNIKTKNTKSPRYPTVRKLADYFKRAA
jgi:hypothetical protein